MLGFLFLYFLSSAHAQNKIEKRVNDHLINATKKVEIESKKREVELQKETLDPIQYNPPMIKKREPFVVIPAPVAPDHNIYRDQYDHPIYNDPVVQAQEDVQYQRDLANQNRELEKERAQYIQEFQENAAKAGIQIQVDPKTLKAKPENDGFGSSR